MRLTETAKGPTQWQMYYASEKKSARLNEAFLDLVNDGLTRKDLQTLIARRPEIYGRFEGWTDKLP
jgi:hypothetical protein